MELRYQPCPDCSSSNAMTVYDDHTHCYSCLTHKFESVNGSNQEPMDIIEPPKKRGNPPPLEGA